MAALPDSSARPLIGDVAASDLTADSSTLTDVTSIDTATDTALSDTALTDTGTVDVPPTGGSGHSPNLATLSQVRSYRRNALLSTSHRRPLRGAARRCTGA